MNKTLVMDVDKWFAQIPTLENDRAVYRHIIDLFEPAKTYRNYSLMNTVLMTVSPDKVSVKYMSAFLRSSYSHRTHLPGWFTTFHRIKSYLSKAGIDANRVLRGMSAPPMK